MIGGLCLIIFYKISRTLATASHPWPPSPVLQPAGRTHSAPESTTTHSPLPAQPQPSSPAPHASRPPLPSWVPPSNSELLCWTRRNSAPVLWPPLHDYALKRLPGKLFYYGRQRFEDTSSMNALQEKYWVIWVKSHDLQIFYCFYKIHKPPRENIKTISTN